MAPLLETGQCPDMAPLMSSSAQRATERHGAAQAGISGWASSIFGDGPTTPAPTREATLRTGLIDCPGPWAPGPSIRYGVAWDNKAKSKPHHRHLPILTSHHTTQPSWRRLSAYPSLLLPAPPPPSRIRISLHACFIDCELIVRRSSVLGFFCLFGFLSFASPPFQEVRLSITATPRDCAVNPLPP